MSDDDVKPLYYYAANAFWLALFLMVLPTEADVLFVLAVNKQGAMFACVAIACSVAVLAPIFLSWRRQRAEPGVWRGRGYLIAATVIWIINLAMFGGVIVFGLLSQLLPDK